MFVVKKIVIVLFLICEIGSIYYFIRNVKQDIDNARESSSVIIEQNIKNDMVLDTISSEVNYE